MVGCGYSKNVRMGLNLFYCFYMVGVVVLYFPGVHLVLCFFPEEMAPYVAINSVCAWKVNSQSSYYSHLERVLVCF